MTPPLPFQQPSDSSAQVSGETAASDSGQQMPLDSAALLRGSRTVEIRHNGEVYRLQSTRLGKLILTK